MGAMEKMKCDYAKLKTELLKRGYTPQTAGLAMGYTTGCFTQARRDGVITTRLLMGLKGLCGIEPEQIAPDPEPTPEPEQMQIVTGQAEPINVTVTIDSAMIANAIIDVLSNEEARKQLSQTIYFAVNRALRNNNYN